MENPALSGAVAALLDEYERALRDLIQVIQSIDDIGLKKIRDPHTQDPDCTSIQTILTHVVHAGFGYTVYIENHLGIPSERPPKKLLSSSQDYIDELRRMFGYCRSFFVKQGRDLNIESYEADQKFRTNWGQLYDIEQIMEHAIVHILRHRRQIERFLGQPSE